MPTFAGVCALSLLSLSGCANSGAESGQRDRSGQGERLSDGLYTSDDLFSEDIFGSRPRASTDRDSTWPDEWSDPRSGTQADPRTGERSGELRAGAVSANNAHAEVVVPSNAAEARAVLPEHDVVIDRRGTTVRTASAMPSINREQEIERLAHELGALLRREADEAPSPAAELARLAALELVAPGVFNTHMVDLQGRSAAAILSDTEIETLTALRGAFARANQTLDNTGSVVRLGDDLRDLADELGAVRPMRVPRALLATRVGGFGIFDELPKRGEAYKRLAGRDHTVIVYAEADSFTYRTTTNRDALSGYSVDLGFDLRLFHASSEGDVLVWQRTGQTLEDFSRNKRRDFYMTQKITLPRTLGVGAYHLKVSVSDRNNPGSVAEAVIPIELVANASALSDAR